MARIRALEQMNGAHALHPTEADGKWAVVSTPEGFYLQLSTYGSDTRASEPKVSQTIQISREIARDLRRALDATFGSPYQP